MNAISALDFNVPAENEQNREVGNENVDRITEN